MAKKTAPVAAPPPAPAATEAPATPAAPPAENPTVGGDGFERGPMTERELFSAAMRERAPAEEQEALANYREPGAESSAAKEIAPSLDESAASMDQHEDTPPSESDPGTQQTAPTEKQPTELELYDMLHGLNRKKRKLLEREQKLEQQAAQMARLEPMVAAFELLQQGKTAEGIDALARMAGRSRSQVYNELTAAELSVLDAQPAGGQPLSPEELERRVLEKFEAKFAEREQQQTQQHLQHRLRAVVSYSEDKELGKSAPFYGGLPSTRIVNESVSALNFASKHRPDLVSDTGKLAKELNTYFRAELVETMRNVHSLDPAAFEAVLSECGYRADQTRERDEAPGLAPKAAAPKRKTISNSDTSSNGGPERDLTREEQRQQWRDSWNSR